MSDKAFKFSVIIKCDGDAQRTAETFESIAAQNCFDESIQVIFLGEEDEAVRNALMSYPDNTSSVYGNGKLLSVALSDAEGKYCLICKAGESVKYKSTFKKAGRLFKDNAGADAVILKLYDREGKGNFLNCKFQNEGSFVDIDCHPDYIHTDLRGVFVSAQKLKAVIGQVGDDNEAVILGRLLSENRIYSLLEDRYICADKNYSAEDLVVFSGSVAREWKKLHKYEFFRKAVVYELSRIISQDFRGGEKEVSDTVKMLLDLVENKDITSFGKIDYIKRLSLLKLKNGSLRTKKKLLSGKVADSCIYADKENVGNSEDIPATLYFVSAENGSAYFEFSMGTVCGLYKEVTPVVTVNGKAVQIRENTDALRYTACLGENITERRMFSLEVGADLIGNGADIKLGLDCDGIAVYPKGVTFNPTCLLEGKYRHHYLYDNGFAFFCRDNTVRVEPCDENKRKALEEAFIEDIANSKLPDKEELISLRKDYFARKDSLAKPIWLISDRPSRAGDNGEVFFEYVAENHSDEVDAYFVISQVSEDYERISKIGRVVEPLSYEHKLLFLLAEKNVSAQADIYVTNPFGKSRRAVHDLMKSDFIFLQHGVIKDDLSDWLRRYKKNIKGFVTSAAPERDSIVNNKNYAYGEDTVWLTGLPRFDKLSDKSRKIITFIPTWRKYLVSAQDSLKGTRSFDGSFTQSDFYKFYNAVVNDERLLSTAEERGYTIAFLPHPNMAEAMHYFSFDDRVTVYDSTKKYAEVFTESSLLVTDYSSAVFDFVYMRKPVVYCQFDRERFFSGEHNYIQGYFDYERDGFGEVEYDASATVDRIIEYMQSGCRMKEKYLSRADSFFAFNDRNNCKRVYEHIIRNR
ncbi:MAG: CDP-glycerol glycerophosphotransferase family protein [Clostridia bacterium]|nr:CDP-glycerol glycerophosphotransferase family protein [Clostridia bacterium]